MDQNSHNKKTTSVPNKPGTLGVLFAFEPALEKWVDFAEASVSVDVLL